MAIEINETNFEEIVNKSTLPVVIDFWAVWCGPCRMIGPIIEELHDEYKGRAIIGKVDVDSAGEIASKFSIRNIPTIIFMKEGKVVDKVVGAVPKATLVEKLNSIL